MDLLKEMMKKKKGEVDPAVKHAKMATLKEIRDMAAGAMGDGLKDGMKKVTVASNDPEGLKEGLDKAKAMVEGSPEEEASESPAEEAAEDMDGDQDGDGGQLHGGPTADHMAGENAIHEDLSPEEEELLKQLLAKKTKSKPVVA